MGECHMLVDTPSVPGCSGPGTRSMALRQPCLNIATAVFCDFSEPRQLRPYKYLWRKDEPARSTYIQASRPVGSCCSQAVTVVHPPPSVGGGGQRAGDN